MTTPNFTLLNDYAQQYGVVQYEDGTFGACNVSHFNPNGNSDPNVPFTGLTLQFDPGNPTQEGAQLAWATKANNMLGTTYLTAQQAADQLHLVLGGMFDLGQDSFNPAHNPFQSQFTPTDFPLPEGQTDEEHF